jgi:hypothetical protein
MRQRRFLPPRQPRYNGDMRHPWLLFACTLSAMFVGLRICAFVLEHFGVDPPRADFVTPEIIAMENRQVEQARLGIVLSIALGGIAGLVAHDAVIRLRPKKVRPPILPRLQFSLRDIFLTATLITLGLAILVLEPPMASSGCIVRFNPQIYLTGVLWGLAAGILTNHKVVWATLGFVVSLFIEEVFY